MATAGSRFIKLMDYVGVGLFSIVGTQVAGDAGFNIIGCSLVGCAAGLGGRSINNILYGASSPILRQLPGVFWARNPMYLAVAIVSSVFTFFAWPIYCQMTSTHYLKDLIGEDHLEKDGCVGEEAFVATCERSEEFLNSIRIGLSKFKGLEDATPREMFRYIDVDGSNKICQIQLSSLVQERVRNSGEIYAVDTAALAAVSVAGVHGAIGMGLHPLVAATSGITMSLGGILRDLMCGRDIAVVSQSYALATGAGSTVYVMTRELALRGYPIFAFYRILLSMGTTIGVRTWEYVRGEPLLAPMHGRTQQQLMNSSKVSSEDMETGIIAVPDKAYALYYALGK